MASSGGSLAIYNPLDKSVIRNTSFLNNKAILSNGGGLYISCDNQDNKF